MISKQEAADMFRELTEEKIRALRKHESCGTDTCCQSCWPTEEQINRSEAHTPTANEVETFSGAYVDTGDPSIATIQLEDIAHALASLCRFGGHSKQFYSVAEHAVFVSRRLETLGWHRDMCLAGLHHDDAEAYLGDIPRPLKLLLTDAYKPLSDRMDQTIVWALRNSYGANHLYVPDLHSTAVKDADNYALLIEAHNLMPSGGINWAGSSLDKTATPATPEYWTGGLDPTAAEGLFLSRHWELVG